MKEVVEYIGRKLIFGSDIHRFLKNKMDNGVPSPTMLIGTGAAENYPANRSSCGRKG